MIENKVDEALQDERIWSVYIHTNKINGKKYVGITSQKPESRWKNCGIGYKAQPFYKAIEKYSWDNFDHEIIASNLTCDEANEFEITLIRELDTLMKNGNGYNTTEGGNSASGENASHVKSVICLNDMTVYPCTKYAEEKYSTTSITSNIKGKHKFAGYDLVTGEKLVWAYYDENLPQQYYEDEKKRKLKRLNTHGSMGKSLNKKKKVICLTTGEIFNGVLEANKAYGINTVSEACRRGYLRGVDKDGNKLRWMYYEDYLENFKEREVI